MAVASVEPAAECQLLRQEFGQVEDLQAVVADELRVVQPQRAGALGAGGDDAFGAAGLELLQVQRGQGAKGLHVALPELVVAAAALVGQHLRLDAQVVQDFHRRPGNLDPLGARSS